jgi:hypothetical protein
MKTFKLLIFLLTISLISCSSDDDSQGDIEQQVENFVSPEVLQALEDLGFNFHIGTDLLDFSGDYIYSPLILEASNVEDEFFSNGATFANSAILTSNIDNDTRTFDADITEEGGITVQGIINTFFIADNNNFNLFIQEESTVSNSNTIVVIRAYSGTLTTEGISNAQLGLFVLSSTDAENDNAIDPGQGRLFVDEDGLAERIVSDDNQGNSILNKTIGSSLSANNINLLSK